MAQKKKTKNQVEEMTLVSALEKIHLESRNSKLSSDFYDKCNDAIAFICNKLNVTSFQAIILSILANNDTPMTFSDMAHHTCSTLLRFRAHKLELDELHYKQFILWIVSRQSIKYLLCEEFLNSIAENKPYTPRKYEDYTTYDVCSKIGKWLKMLEDDSNLYDTIVRSSRQLLDSTKHLSFSKDLLTSELDDIDLMILLRTITDKVETDSEYISSYEISEIFPEEKRIKNTLIFMNEGSSFLMENKWMENYTVNGLVETNKFILTDKVLDTTLADLKAYMKQHVKARDRTLLMPEDIKEKSLFYNKRESEEVQRLTELLSIDKFKDIQKRLRDANMRPGFACLFYGAPGTGKTETVLQLGKKTGRPIFQVNISEIRSKWVGESEKNVQELFNKYDSIVEAKNVCPILFFNEADAVISKRSNNVDDAVDKMENTIQNILLQAMENLSGIMIATTNLTNNMDSAFERRFLYKICFDKPTIETRAHIWQSMLPNLSSEEANNLAKEYDFSGGQIENIARKQIVDSILYDQQQDLASVKSYCENENIRNFKKSNIGFVNY